MPAAAVSWTSRARRARRRAPRAAFFFPRFSVSSLDVRRERARRSAAAAACSRSASHRGKREVVVLAPGWPATASAASQGASTPERESPAQASSAARLRFSRYTSALSRGRALTAASSADARARRSLVCVGFLRRVVEEEGRDALREHGAHRPTPNFRRSSSVASASSRSQVDFLVSFFALRPRCRPSLAPPRRRARARTSVVARSTGPPSCRCASDGRAGGRPPPPPPRSAARCRWCGRPPCRIWCACGRSSRSARA